MELELDEIEIEIWNRENQRARKEYYVSPGPHPATEGRVRGSSAVSPRFPAGPVRQALEQAMDALWSAQNQAASQRRLITDLYRRIIDFEIRVGDRNPDGTMRDVREQGADDGAEGDGVLFSAVRPEAGAA